MGIVSRPNKTSSGTTEFAPDTDILANEANADFNALLTEINGKLSAANMDPNPALPGTMIAAAPSGIPTDRINNLAVTTAKIDNSAVTEDKLANSAVAQAKLKKAVFSNPTQIDVTANADHNFATGLLDTVLPISYYFTEPQVANLGIMALYKNLGVWWVRFHNHSAIPVISILIGKFELVYLNV